jgi:tetratricopeptide (TPR) repeat protein
VHAWPHRVTLLAPTLRLIRPEEPLAPMAAHLLAHAVFESLCRHPVVALTDPEDQELDADGQLVNAAHPKFQAAAQHELGDHRRDEVLWLDVQLDPAQPPYVALYAWTAGGHSEQWAGGGATLSQMIESCLHQWLAARHLPPSPRPLEPFTLAELAQGYQSLARIVSAMKSSPGVAQALVEGVKKLVVPMLRLADAATSQSYDQKILAADPENPKSLLLTANGDVAKLRRVVELAPQWGRGHLALTAELVGPAAALGHQAIAATLMPLHAGTVESYAEHLRRAGRHEEAYRIARRCSRLVPRFIPAHIGVLAALRELERPGEGAVQAEARRRALADLWAPGRMPPPVDGPMRKLMLAVADANCDVGRLDDAIRWASEATHGAQLPEWSARVAMWREKPQPLARAYARDGHARGEHGRVLDGFSRGGIETGLDAAFLIQSLSALGRDDVAACIHAQVAGTGLLAQHGAGQAARLAGARSLLLIGELSRAYREIQSVQLAFPQSKLESHVNRLGRLAATRPIAEWDQAIRERLDAGAKRLARLLARECADFHPQAVESPALREALGQLPGIVFDRAWIDPMRQALGASNLVDIDLFFHNHQAPTLETADRLVAGWPALVAARNANDPTAAAQSLFLLGQALCRYFALTTQPPTPLAGAYRQIATDVLALLGRAGVEWLDQSLRPFLAALDAAAPGVDPWILDAWLLRTERALELDAARGGHVIRLSHGLRWVSAYLRGDERIAFELRLARDLGKNPEAAPQVRDLLERNVRAHGSPEVVGEWADSLGDQIDELWLAATASPTHGRAHLRLGRALLANPKTVDAAVESLARGLVLTPAAAREAALAELRPAWRIDLPFEAADATSRGVASMRAGKFEEAIRPLRWAAAAAPSPAATKNLGIALGRGGHGLSAITAYALHDGSMKGVAQAFYEAKRYDWAARAHRAAQQLAGWDEADCLTLGKSARLAGDDEVAADAYGQLYFARNGQLAPPELAQYAQALAGIGEWDRCEEVSRRLVGAAGGDQVLAASAMNSLARALLGRGRIADALQHAQLALQVPIPEVRKEYQATVEAAQRGVSPPLPPRRGATAVGRALAALANQDLQKAHELAVSEQSWGATRAQMTIAQFRSDLEAMVPVAGAARQFTDGILQATAGQVDPDAVLCRCLALLNREQISFPIDPPPVLPPRLPRERFEQLWEARRH